MSRFVNLLDSKHYARSRQHDINDINDKTNGTVVATKPTVSDLSFTSSMSYIRIREQPTTDEKSSDRSRADVTMDIQPSVTYGSGRGWVGNRRSRQYDINDINDKTLCCICGGAIVERLPTSWGGQPCHRACGEAAFQSAKAAGAYDVQRD